MTPFRWFIAAALASFVALAVLATMRSDRAVVVKTGVVLNRDHPTAASLFTFKQKLEELSGGTMRVDLFFDSQLGSAQQVLELARLGDVEMTLISTAELTPYVVEANAVTMPFIWDGPEHQFAKMDGEVGQILRERARRQNIEILGYLDSGSRNITTRRGPIQRPEDLRGMNIRVMPSPLMIVTVNALGAAGVALNWGEVYTALQMGVIDGWENNPTTIATSRMWETGCTWFAWTRHFSLPDVFVAGSPFYQSLTDQQRGWVEEAAQAMVEAQRRLWQESEERSLQQMREAGMTINEVDVEAFRQRVEPLYELYYQRYGSDFQRLCEMILDR